MTGTANSGSTSGHGSSGLWGGVSNKYNIRSNELKVKHWVYICIFETRLELVYKKIRGEHLDGSCR
jgi:hypothetical protein